MFEQKSSKGLGAYAGYNDIYPDTSFCGVGGVLDDVSAYLNGMVYTCVHEIATSAASVQFKLRNTITKEEIGNSLKIQEVLAIPNPIQDRTTFWEQVYGHYLLSGNIGIEAVANNRSKKELKELWCIPFNNVSIVIDKTRGTPLKYVIKNYSKEVTYKILPLSGKTNLLHLHTFNPDPERSWMGVSPIAAATKDINIFDKSADWNTGLLKNGARPSGAFVYDDDQGGILTEEAFERLQDQIAKKYTGPTNAGTPLLLEGGLKWNQYSLSPADMDFLNSRLASARIIAGIFGYPSMLLGISGDNTYNNQKEARLALWTDTIMPLNAKIATQLSTFLHRNEMLDRTIELVPDYDDIGALQPIRDAVWERAAKQGKDILTINERRELIGMKQMPGLDGIIANAAQVPVTYALCDPAERTPVTLAKPIKPVDTNA